MSPLFGWRKRGSHKEPERKWVVVYFAQNLPDGELQAARLKDADIPVFVRRTANMDVPDMLAGGRRELLVPEHYELEARAILDPYDPLGEGDEEASVR
ncbi:MAG: hypothetical protein OEM67_08665 [Thermoleophilia bacterium]|nr:hypothetical protein [Thermoleophilia bacterium]